MKMVTESNRTRKGPLSGDRQGASGAGAEHDSMRTANRERCAARSPAAPRIHHPHQLAWWPSGSSRSNIFDISELEQLRREAVPSSDENATAEDVAPQLAEQPANVDAAVNTPVVVNSNDDGTVAQELEMEKMRSMSEEAIAETRSTPLENRPRLPRIALSKRN
ncbi:unnamed protein product [Parnassius apollo]|uniref:(apollo) hypothetical protein n=1 Tax=Parnassius apollo TaxID=110799 RepID=A0A8S3YFB2_PARAO|nr:unnamed protein product [Parnassius apollo]